MNQWHCAKHVFSYIHSYNGNIYTVKVTKILSVIKPTVLSPAVKITMSAGLIASSSSSPESSQRSVWED